MKSSVVKEDTIGHDGKRTKQGGFDSYMREITYRDAATVGNFIL